MALDRTHRLAGLGLALLCSLSLVACNSGAQNSATATDTGTEAEQSESTATDTTAGSENAAGSTEEATALLDASTETGPVKAVGSVTFENSDMNLKATYTYDDAGNLTEVKNEGTVAGVSSNETVTTTFNGNAYASRKSTTESDGTTQTLEGTYEPAEYAKSGDGGTLTLTYNEKEATTGADITTSDAYYLSDDGKTITGYTMSGQAIIPASDTSTEDTTSANNADTSATTSADASDTTTTDNADATDTTSANNASASSTSSDSSKSAELNSTETYTFNADGLVTELAVDLMGSTGTTEFTYEGDTMKTSGGDINQTWTLTKDADGLITQAVNEEAGTTLTIEYVEIANPTDFNRALAKVSAGQTLADAVYGQVGGEFATALKNYADSTDQSKSDTSSTDASTTSTDTAATTTDSTATTTTN